MLKFSFACLIVLPILFACAAHNGAWEKKVEPRLRAAVQDGQVQTQAAQNLQVLIKCQAPLSHEQKQKLAEHGVRVQAEAGAILTAALPAHAVTEVAKLDYVIYLELSKERKVQPQGN